MDIKYFKTSEKITCEKYLIFKSYNKNFISSNLFNITKIKLIEFENFKHFLILNRPIFVKIL